MRARHVLLIALFLAGAAAGQDLRIYHIDVSQGDATLIVGPTGIACLIDAGDVGKGNQFVIPLLNQLGITQLEWTIVTHYHADHYGAIPELVAQGFLPQVAAYDRGPTNQPTGTLFTQYLSAVGAKRATMAIGTVLDLGGGATLTCVGSNGAALGGASVTVAGTSQEENSRSLALRLSYGNYQEAILGDCTGGGSGSANVEAIIGPAMGNVDVYKVSHHGSFTSSSPGFLAAIGPEVCSISCGDGNPYGHPHQSVLDALFAQPTVVKVYRLNEGDPASLGGDVVGGTLLIQTNGAAYTCTGPLITPLIRVVDEGGGGPPAQFLPGDVVISEYMQNPGVVADSVGEWIELRNMTLNAINLVGFRLRDQGTDQFVLPSLTLPAGGLVTVGNDGNPALNGGYTPDYTWPAGTMFLGNGSDELELVSPIGTVLDAVAWGTGTGMPSMAGKSVERKGATAPPWASNFGHATTAFGAGDLGTPGATNSIDQTPPLAVLVAGAAPTPGGITNLTLGASGTAGKPYVMMLSLGASGIVMPSDGRVIPVDFDWLLEFSLTAGNGVTSGFLGTMNFTGLGFGSVAIPPAPWLSGFALRAGGVVIDGFYPDGIGSIAPSILLTIQ